MKKLIIFLVSLCIFLSFNNCTSAIAPPPSNGTSPNFLGQDQYYSVTFRGNGEAVVNLKVILSNLQEEPLSTVSLRVPKVDPKDIAVYQIIRKPTCIRYKTYDYGQSSSGLSKEEMEMMMPCEEYSEPNYYDLWYGSNKYQKAKYELKGDTIIVELPNAIKPSSSGSFIVYYRALGYAKKNIVGKYNFIFETLKVEDKIRDLQVGINTDSDLYLRGAKGKVNYRFEENFAALKSSESMMGAPVENTQFDNYYQQIGQGSITKKASSLQPLDSYTVKGSYADSVLKLYAKDILMATTIVVVIISLIVLLIKFLLGRLNKGKTDQSGVNVGVRAVDLTMVLTTFGISFITSIFIVAYTVFLLFLVFAMNTYFYLGESAVILIIFLIIISVAIYGLLLVVPGIYLGIKKGVFWGMGVFGLTIFWLALYLIIILLVLSARRSDYYPVPFMMNLKQQTESVSSGEIKK